MVSLPSTAGNRKPSANLEAKSLLKNDTKTWDKPYHFSKLICLHDLQEVFLFPAGLGNNRVIELGSRDIVLGAP
jgi:hypothetical protein